MADIDTSPYVRTTSHKSSTQVCKKGSDEPKKDEGPCLYGYKNYIMIAIIVILVIIIAYKLYMTFGISDGFIEQTIKTGQEMDYDLEDELTKLRNMQEENLAKLPIY